MCCRGNSTATPSAWEGLRAMSDSLIGGRTTTLGCCAKPRPSLIERLVRRPPMSMRPKAISLYTGAGGLDYGIEAAGFQTSVALDSDHDSCETLRKNRRWPVIERSIFATSTEEI